MKTIFIITISLFILTPAFSQSDHEEIANEVYKAIKFGNVQEFIHCCVATTEELRALNKVEKEQLSEEAGSDEERDKIDSSYRKSEQDFKKLENILKQKAKNKITHLANSTERFGIKWNHIKLQDIKVRESSMGDNHWAMIQVLLSTNDKPYVVQLDHVNIVNGKWVYGPATNITMQGFEPYEVLVKDIIKAAGSNDISYFKDNCLLSDKVSKKMLSTMMEGRELDEETKSKLFSDETFEKQRKNQLISFKEFIKKAEESGVNWKNTEVTWIGKSSHFDGTFHQLVIPFNIKSGDKIYRAEILHCSQLPERTDIAIGEINWIGPVE